MQTFSEQNETSFKQKCLWTKENDSAIRNWVTLNGEKKWIQLGKQINKTGKQCRERWFNYLNPQLKQCDWTKQEEIALCNYLQMYGTQWSKIAKKFVDRSENYLKNKFYIAKRKLNNLVSKYLSSIIFNSELQEQFNILTAYIISLVLNQHWHQLIDILLDDKEILQYDLNIDNIEKYLKDQENLNILCKNYFPQNNLLRLTNQDINSDLSHQDFEVMNDKIINSEQQGFTLKIKENCKQIMSLIQLNQVEPENHLETTTTNFLLQKKKISNKETNEKQVSVETIYKIAFAADNIHKICKSILQLDQSDGDSNASTLEQSNTLKLKNKDFVDYQVDFFLDFIQDDQEEINNSY